MQQMSTEHALQHALRQHQAGRFQQAEQLYRQILSREPNHPNALYLLGVLALQTNHAEAAEELLRRSIAINPRFPEGHYGLGAALQQKGRYDEAIACYDRALTLNPQSPDAHWHRATAFLLYGNFKPAWREFEWRFKWKTYDTRTLSQPRWDGSDLSG